MAIKNFSNYRAPLSFGNRSGLVTVTTTWTGGTLANLTNGNLEDSYAPNNQAAAGLYLRFQFPDPIICDGLWFSIEREHGFHQFQGSNDGSTWTNIGSAFQLYGSGEVGSPIYDTKAPKRAQRQFFVEFDNDTPYTYYQLLGVSGNIRNSPIAEVMFRQRGSRFAFGDRLAFLKVSGAGNIWFDNDVRERLFDGLSWRERNYNLNRNGQTVDSTSWLKVEYPVAVCISKYYFNSDGANNIGTWQFQGSNDNATWDNLGAATQLGNVGEWQVVDLSNTTKYRFYRWLGVSGTCTNISIDGFYFRVTDEDDAPDVLQSYYNLGGQGERTAMFSATMNYTAGGTSAPINLVDGLSVNNDNGSLRFATNEAVSGKYIRFQFLGSPRIISKVRILSATTANRGTHQWEGSNDGSSWTPLGSPMLLSGSKNYEMDLENETVYQYYQMAGVSGNIDSGYFMEFAFEVSGTYYEANGKGGCNFYGSPGGVNWRDQSWERNVEQAFNGVGASRYVSFATPDFGYSDRLTFCWGQNPRTLDNTDYLHIDFPEAIDIKGCFINFDTTSAAPGFWRWHGSNDGFVSENVALEGATLGGAMQGYYPVSTEETPYKSYRMYGESGSFAETILWEILFDLAPGAGTPPEPVALSQPVIIITQ